MKQIIEWPSAKTQHNPTLMKIFREGLDAYKSGKYATAITKFTHLADKGNADAQCNLGLMHANGLGVPQNYAEALKWFWLAADAELPDAQYFLGVMYEEGRGDVPQNYAEAMKLYRLVIDNAEFPEAEYRLGVMYEEGVGVPQNYAEAKKYYRRAVSMRSTDAEYRLGMMYEGGRGVPEDDEKALNYLLNAAKAGNADAQNHLGMACKKKKAATLTAYMWLNLAAAQGHEEARKNRDLMAKRMSRGEINEAQKMSQEQLEQSC